MSSGLLDFMSAKIAQRRWLCYVPVAFLIVVACIQIWLTQTAEFSPWSGGGFGMFSTTDTRGSRHLHAFAIRPGIHRELEIPRLPRERIPRLLACPTEFALQSLATDLAAIPSPDTGLLEAIEIQIWVTRFDPDSLAPSSAILRAVKVPIGTP